MKEGLVSHTLRNFNQNSHLNVINFVGEVTVLIFPSLIY